MPLDKKPVMVLWNSASGWQDDHREAQNVEQIFSAIGSRVRFERLEKGQDITARSRSLLDDQSTLMVAAGGDGTINAVASAIANTSHVLGVIPAGTLNHFARDLEIPLNPEEAAATIVAGREIQVDVGTVNGRLFINNCVLGLYPVYRAARDAYERKGLKANRVTRFLAVVRSFIRVLWHLPRLDLNLTLEDGRSVRRKTAFVLIANNEHEVEQWNIGHRKCVDQGHLWIYILKRCTRWGLFRFFIQFLLKRFSRHDAFEIFKARAASVDGRFKHLKVGVDGEIMRFQTPLDFKSQPRALRVIAPAATRALAAGENA